MKSGIENIDLNLLLVFKHVFDCRSVSKAAEKLGRSQSMVSYDLTKLRRHFGDPLFTKTSTGVQPTKLACELAGPIAGGPRYGRALGGKGCSPKVLFSR